MGRKRVRRRPPRCAHASGGSGSEATPTSVGPRPSRHVGARRHVPCVRWTVCTGWATDAQAPWRRPVSQQWSSLGAAELGTSGAGSVRGTHLDERRAPRLEAYGWREAPEGSGGESNTGSGPFLTGSRWASPLGQLPLPIPLSASAVGHQGLFKQLLQWPQIEPI